MRVLEGEFLRLNEELKEIKNKEKSMQNGYDQRLRDLVIIFI